MSDECGGCGKTTNLDDDWCIPYKGTGANKPRGVILPAGITAKDLILKVAYAPESKTPINVAIDEKVYRAINGPQNIKIGEATSTNEEGGISREAWLKKYGYDGLGYWLTQQMGAGPIKPIKLGGRR